MCIEQRIWQVWELELRGITWLLARSGDWLAIVLPEDEGPEDDDGTRAELTLAA